jgi:hypothetical protein
MFCPCKGQIEEIIQSKRIFIFYMRDNYLLVSFKNFYFQQNEEYCLTLNIVHLLKLNTLCYN